VAITAGQLTGCQSLRDTESCLSTQRHLHYHLGTLDVSQSALGRANEQRDATFYTQLFQVLSQRCTHHTPRHGFRFKHKLFSLDGSLLNASLKLFPWADYNRKKAAFKLHVGLDHDGLIPCFAQVTEGRVSENEQARVFDAPKESVVVFDKSYNNYRWHKELTDKGIYWATRIRGNAKYRVLERRETLRNTAVTSDLIIKYSSKQSDCDKLNLIRRIGYHDPDTAVYQG